MSAFGHYTTMGINAGPRESGNNVSNLVLNGDVTVRSPGRFPEITSVIGLAAEGFGEPQFRFWITIEFLRE